MTEPATVIGWAERAEFVHRSWPAYSRHLAALRAEVGRWLAPLALPGDAGNDAESRSCAAHPGGSDPLRQPRNPGASEPSTARSRHADRRGTGRTGRRRVSRPGFSPAARSHIGDPRRSPNSAQVGVACRRVAEVDIPVGPAGPRCVISWGVCAGADRRPWPRPRVQPGGEGVGALLGELELRDDRRRAAGEDLLAPTGVSVAH